MPVLSYRLLNYTTDPERGGGTAVYGFEHVTDGRGGTHLAFEVHLRLRPDGPVEATLHLEGCQAATPVEALDRLGGWLHRAAQAVASASTPSSAASDPSDALDVARQSTLILPMGQKIRVEEGEPHA